MLAERLGREGEGRSSWSVFDANLIETMLRENHFSPEIAAYLPERRLSEVNALIGEIVGLHPNLWSLIQKTNRLTRELARRGRAIFVGRGAAFATAGFRHGVHIRLVAPAEYRARQTAERLGISIQAAAAENRRKDAARRAYVRANFSADGTDPTVYDMVINTARVPLAEAAEIVISLVSSAIPASA